MRPGGFFGCLVRHKKWGNKNYKVVAVFFLRKYPQLDVILRRILGDMFRKLWNACGDFTNCRLFCTYTHSSNHTCNLVVAYVSGTPFSPVVPVGAMTPTPLLHKNRTKVPPSNMTLLQQVLSLWLLVESVRGCSDILVTPGATVDGSAIIAYNADEVELFGYLYHYPPTEGKAGEILKVYEWDTGVSVAVMKIKFRLMNVLTVIFDLRRNIWEIFLK